MLSETYRREKIPLTRAFGNEYPERFLDPATEYDALVRACGVIDLTHRRVIRVGGRDRAGFLDALVTNDVASLAPGKGCHALVTTGEGTIVSELLVHALEKDYVAVVSQGDFEETIRLLEPPTGGLHVTVDDLSAERGVLAVEGPEAGKVIRRLLGNGPLPKGRFDIVERPFEAFTVLVTQDSATGESGFHVIVPSGEASRIRDYLVQAARGSDGLPVGLTAWGIRRVEAGLPWYGADFTGEDFPGEARLEEAVSYTKGPYRGREALSRLKHPAGARRGLVGFVAEDDGPARTAVDGEHPDWRGLLSRGAPIYSRGRGQGKGGRSTSEPVGFVTSAVYSRALRKPLLMGRVPRELPEADRAIFTVGSPPGALGLTAILLPIEIPRV